MKKRNVVLGVIGAVVVVFLLIQLVPVDRTNPAVQAEPNWDSPQTRALVKDACFDCHSNETVWPWYSKIAPISWLAVRDVDEGRESLNFSEWGSTEAELDEIVESIDEDEMPLWFYAILHPEADLSDSDKQQMIDGLNATFAQSGGSTQETEHEDDD